MPARLARRARAFLPLSSLMLSLVARAALPQFAVSLPAGVSAATAADRCGVKDTALVMPALRLNLGGQDSPDAAFDQQTRTISGLNGDAEVYLHVSVGAGTMAGDVQRQVNDRVAAFLKRLPLQSAPVRGLILEPAEPAVNLDAVTFAVIDLAVQAKAAKPGLRLAFVFPAGFIGRNGDVARRLATYFDLLGIAYVPGWESDARWVAESGLNKPLLFKLSGATAASYAAARMESSETLQMIWADSPDEAALASTCAADHLLSRFVTKDMNAVPASSVSFTLAGAAAAKWFLSPSADIAALARVNGAPGRPASLKLHAASGSVETQWYDVLSGMQLTPGPIIKTPGSLDQTASCECQFALVFIHNTSESGRAVSESLEVKGRADLTVEEIIARWQQYREAQRQKLENYIADCVMELHFESTNLVPAIDIMFHFKEFVKRDSQPEWQQIDSYVDGVKFGHNQEFPLPQLEPKKVLTQPLELTLNAKYNYKLLGTEQVNGVLCYVLSLEPAVQGETLFSGKIWIDGATFRQVKEYLTERDGKSNVLSDVETQIFDLVADAQGNKFNLLTSITAQQLTNAADRDFVIQKSYQFSGFIINARQYDEELKSAYASNDPMFRDTDKGLQRLVKKDNQRVLDENTGKTVKAIVGGAMYEAAYSFPIPIAGYSFSDFNYHETGTQLSMFFAGPVLAANASKQYGPRFRLGLDLALSGLPGYNRVYSRSTELKGQQMLTWEQSTGLRATWQMTAGLSFTASYYVAWDFFRPTSETSPLYTLPRDGFSLMPSATLKYQHKGYIFTAQDTYVERLGWRRFGYANDPDPLHPNYNLYNADFNKTYYLPKFMRAGWDFSYYGGNDQDRIGRYWPGFFATPQLHGIPGGVDSFDALAMGNVSYGFNIFDVIKLEGLYSYARGRDLEESRAFKKYDGAEVNFGTAGPWATYLQGTVSYALDGNLDRYNSRWAVLFMIFKPLK